MNASTTIKGFKMSHAIEFNKVITTGGNGLWSKVKANVQMLSIAQELHIEMAKDEGFNSIGIYFDTASWDVKKNGLIYTDDAFLENVKKEFIKMGLDAVNLEYAEWEMQGDNYVCFDADYPLALGLSKLI